MSGRGRGRPQITKREYWTRVLWLEALVEEEEAAMRWQGRKPVKALARAAIRLDMSYRSARRLLSPTGGTSQGRSTGRRPRSGPPTQAARRGQQQRWLDIFSRFRFFGH